LNKLRWILDSTRRINVNLYKEIRLQC